MDNAKLCIDWNLNDISRYDLSIKIFNPTPEQYEDGLIFFQWHFNFKGEGGYIGFQLTETGKKAIFSIWQPLRGCMGDFIEEQGPVYRCLLDYQWELNQKYRLTVKEGKEEDEGRWWIGEIYDCNNNVLTTIGKIFIPQEFEKLKGYNYYTCIETGYFKDGMIPDIKAKFSDNIARARTISSSISTDVYSPIVSETE